MVVGGEQGFCPQTPGAGGVFQHRPGNGHAVIGGGAPADFVQNQQAPGGGVFQNVGDLRHFHHKGGLPGGQVVAGADAGEDPVSKADFRRAGGDEGSHLGHQDDQRHLAHIGGFARHVGAGDNADGVVLPTDAGVVGHKKGILQHGLHHRVPSALDGNFPSQGDFRTAVAPLNRHGGEAAQGVRSGHGGGGLLHPGGLLGKIFPQLGENLIFQGGEPVLGGEHLVFQLLQFLGDVAFAVGQGLLADVVFRHLVDKGLGYFNIISEHPVEAHLQGADAGFLPLRGLDGGDGAAAALHNVPQTVGFLAGALADDAALPDGQGRIVNQGVFNPVGAVRQGIDGLLQLPQQGRFAFLQLGLHLRQRPEAPGQTQKVPAVDGARDDAGLHPL